MSWGCGELQPVETCMIMYPWLRLSDTTGTGFSSVQRSRNLDREVCMSEEAQMVEHGTSNANIMGSIPRESKS